MTPLQRRVVIYGALGIVAAIVVIIATHGK